MVDKFIIVQVIGMLIIAGITACIAYQQWKTNKNRLAVELFNKRYKAYDALMHIYSSIMRNGKLTNDVTAQYWRYLNEGEFLFDDARMAEYFREVTSKINQLNGYMALLEEDSLRHSDPLDEIGKKALEIQEWVGEEYAKSRHRFRRFLTLRM